MLGAGEVARVCHEAERAYCRALGDHSMSGWDQAPMRVREAMVGAVEGLRRRLAGGEGDACLVPLDDLSEGDRVKAVLFGAVVRALSSGESLSARKLEEVGPRVEAGKSSSGGDTEITHVVGSPTLCRGCGAEVRWLEMKSGKRMIVEAEVSDAVVVAGPEGWELTRKAWVPHWGDCPRAGDFRG